MRLWPALLCLCGTLLWASCGWAASISPGFKTLGVWLPEPQIRLDINVWYPSVRRTSEVDYGYWVLNVARNGKAQEGQYPLLLLSHDSTGTRFSYHETAAYLAGLGFVVAAPTHVRDNMDNMPDLYTVRQLELRVRELVGTLDVLLHDEEMRNRIDPTRVGVLGYGVGATAALLLGGALLTPENWPSYCANAAPGDVFCAPWARPRMEKMVQALPLPASLADTRIKAVCAVAPAYAMLFSKESLRYVYPPVEIITPLKDAGVNAGWQGKSLRALLPKVPYYKELPDADALALAACPRALRKQLPDFCGFSTPSVRRAAMQTVNDTVGAFFLQFLGGAEPVPIIPDPPMLRPEQPESRVQEAPASAQNKPRRRRK